MNKKNVLIQILILSCRTSLALCTPFTNPLESQWSCHTAAAKRSMCDWPYHRIQSQSQRSPQRLLRHESTVTSHEDSLQQLMKKTVTVSMVPCTKTIFSRSSTNSRTYLQTQPVLPSLCPPQLQPLNQLHGNVMLPVSFHILQQQTAIDRPKIVRPPPTRNTPHRVQPANSEYRCPCQRVVPIQKRQRMISRRKHHLDVRITVLRV